MFRGMCKMSCHVTRHLIIIILYYVPGIHDTFGSVYLIRSCGKHFPPYATLFVYFDSSVCETHASKSNKL